VDAVRDLPAVASVDSRAREGGVRGSIAAPDFVLDWFALQTGLHMSIDDRRLALIRLVSREYGSLLGLFNMALAVIIGSGAAWTLVFGFRWALFAVGFAAVAVAFQLTTSYYSRRFGRVRPRVEETPQTWIQRFSFVYGVAVAAALILDRKLQGSGMPSLFFLVLTVPTVWRAIRDWPFQAHWLLFVLAGLLGSVLFVFVERGESHEQWMATSLCVVSVALFIAGWLDHRLIVRALGRGTSTNEGSEVNEPVVR
jgi:hypothetical protein